MRGNYGVTPARSRSVGLTTIVMWAAALAASAALGACSQSNAEADSARTSPAATATPPGADSGNGASAGTVIVPAAQLAKLHIEPVAISNFRPTIQATGTAQFNADVSTQVLAPISGPVTRILAEPGASVRAGQPLALVSSPDFAATVADTKARPPIQPAAELIDPDKSTPFSSSTLAELYYQQGLVDRAVDVYRQLLQQEPTNQRARLRLVELETAGAPPPEPAAAVDERTARRRALERTIAGLEALLAAVQRKGA